MLQKTKVIKQNIAEARKDFSSIPEILRQDNGNNVLQIKKYKKPVLAILPWDIFEILIDTLEILSDPVEGPKLITLVKDVKN